jgi:putative ABC transport system permease protein
MIIEMLVSFLVIFAVFSLLVFYYDNYKQPTGFDYNDVWAVSYSSPENIQSNDSAMLFFSTVKQMLRSMPEIKDLSFTSNNITFSMSSSN